MENGQTLNELFLHGRAAEDARLSHVNHGRAFWQFPLCVRRLSGTEDRLNVLVTRIAAGGTLPAAGEEVTVRGEVRSFNNRSGQGSRLVITAYARTLVREQREDDNRLALAGALCKPPVYRCTPMGREICDVILAVNRRYGWSDYLPCIAWGALARRCGALDVGDRLRLHGRLQSRTYVKRTETGQEERTAFEVSVMELDGDPAKKDSEFFV